MFYFMFYVLYFTFYVLFYVILHFMLYFMFYTFYVLFYVILHFVLYFMFYICSFSCSEIHYFITELWYPILIISNDSFSLFSVLEFSFPIQMIAFHCSQYWSLVSPLLLASLSPNDWGKWDTAIHDGIVPLPWKQAKFNLWAFCSLSRREQSLIVQIFGFIWFVNFELRFANQESLTLPQVTLNSFFTIKSHQD